MKITSYRQALFVYCGIMLALTFPYWGLGEELVSSCHAVVMGVSPMTPQQQACEQRKFTDFENDFLPEVHNQITAPRTGFMALQFADNEMGRQTRMLAGKTPANFYTWLVFQISQDAYRILTILALSMAFLGGIFGLLVCRELQLTPLAGLIGALFIATNPFTAYWLTFPMHIASICWSAGAFWGIVRMQRRGDAVAWGVLAFSVYSLLMMGYLQTVVYSVWIFGAYIVWQAWQQKTAWRAMLMWCLRLIGAALIGAVLVLPAYLDLWQQYRISAQPRSANSFFTHFIQVINNWDGVWWYVSVHTIPEVFGNPMSGIYPFQFDGLSVPVFYGVLMVLASVLCWRKVWLWVVWLGILLALSVSPTLFTWVIHAIPGFRFSQWAPIWSGVLPLALVAAYGCDALLTSALRQRITATIVGCLLGLGVIGVMALRVAQQLNIGLMWNVVAVVVLIAIGYVVLTRRVIPNLVVGMALLTIAYSTYPLMLHQPRTALVTQSQLVDTIQRTLRPSERYAVVSAEIADILSPNFNTMPGLASVHSYHNFTSFYYQNYLRQMGGKSVTFGRLNRTIAPDYAAMTFWMSNIGVVLSSAPIDDPHVVLVKKTGAAMVYRVTHQMGAFWRIPVSLRPGISDIRVDAYHNRQFLRITTAEYRGDSQFMRYPVIDQTSLMVLSQQYDELWQAEVYDGVAWHPTRIVSVNGVFMGVYLPAQSHAMRMTYHAYMQYMWIAHLIWAIGLSVIALWCGRLWWQRNLVQRDSVNEELSRR